MAEAWQTAVTALREKEKAAPDSERLSEAQLQELIRVASALEVDSTPLLEELGQRLRFILWRAKLQAVLPPSRCAAAIFSASVYTVK